MVDWENPLWWLLGFLALGILFVFLRAHFGAEARESRRRRRSHGRVVSRARQPSIKLAVKSGKAKD